MWPWEHAIVGYVVYSLFVRVVYRDSPGGLEAFAVVFASVLPDVIDKPLAWEFGVFETGYAIGHSIFFAVPLAIFAGLAARATGRQRAGVAFGLGYLLHLPGDVFYSYIGSGLVRLEILLWPVESVDSPGQQRRTGFAETFLRLFDDYQGSILAGDLSPYLRLQLGLAGIAFLLWLADGAPVLRELLLGGKRFACAIHRRMVGPPADSPRRR
ncbi:metal-dependent hydrolase [Halosolutus amylolyticus]|uniref:Metal-dependent hydrolase n=1 Tax=Halosolutus amylolyticus TaxID=2932267 RepID=A0ABD5PN14_9EURY|nr:metal-dependent hydrolase [Halosolutus amylolyticus]